MDIASFIVGFAVALAKTLWKIIQPLLQVIAPRLTLLSIDENPVNSPPFAIAFEDATIPNEYIGPQKNGIQLTAETIWVDCAKIQVDITNKDPQYDINVVDIQVEIKKIPAKWSSALQYITQGAKKAFRFEFDLSKHPTTATLVEKDYTTKQTKDNFFNHNNFISIESGKMERFIISLTDPPNPLEVQVAFLIRIKSKIHRIKLRRFKRIIVIPKSSVPDKNLYFTIQGDSLLERGKFLQSNFD